MDDELAVGWDIEEWDGVAEEHEDVDEGVHEEGDVGKGGAVDEGAGMAGGSGGAKEGGGDGEGEGRDDYVACFRWMSGGNGEKIIELLQTKGNTYSSHGIGEAV